MIWLFVACAGAPAPVESVVTDPEPSPAGFVDRTDQLPALTGFCMDAAPVDVDADGDRDLLLAQEFRDNILLLNDGTGRFTDASDRLPRTRRDSEDIAIGDFDGDGDPDALFVSEDDRVNELFVNDGEGTFTDGSAAIPVQGTSNAVVGLALDDDGRPDVVIGNAGPNTALLGGAPFVDATDRLPDTSETTQDLEAGDVDGDGDLDLVVANESDNALWLDDGGGRFRVAEGALEARASPEETREAELGDVDGDGDLDLLFANIRFLVGGADRANRLLLNDGGGRFTTAPFPVDDDDTFDVELLDLDGDGDLDAVTANLDSLSGRPAAAPYRVYANDGQGGFTEATAQFFPASAVGNGFDIEGADFTGDGGLDLFLCSRGGQDRLLVGPTPATQ